MLCPSKRTLTALMTNTAAAPADNIPVIVAAAQHVERITDASGTQFSSPMDLAAHAARAALIDAQISASEVDTIGVVRLFSDAAKAWASPFGGSNNPPQSVARRIGAQPKHRIYSNAGGTQPLQLLMEACQSIARGEMDVALLVGTEAIANQRFALKKGYEADWSEAYDTPLDNREYRKRFAAPQDLGSGMSLPVHYYALIENLQGHRMGQNLAAHRQHMAQMMAPFSTIAANNPHAQFEASYTPQELTDVSRANYNIATPYSKRFIAQDAVNQSCALVLTSVGRARELGIHPGQWVFPTAYAEGQDRYLCERQDPTRSEAMQRVIEHTLNMAQAQATELDLIDIYSCFPCAVQAACDVLSLPTDGSVPLTVTGGLPYFGGPGNNYSMHALAEMAHRLRGSTARGLVTANGGILSKHAAVVLQNTPAPHAVVDWGQESIYTVEPQDIAAVPMVATANQGTVLSFTVIDSRDGEDLGIVLAETSAGARFFASCVEPATTADMKITSPIGRAVDVSMTEKRLLFQFTAA
jgi:acetyl-CoA C-acetyltransferase